MLATQSPKQNQLLGALPSTDYQRLLPQLEKVHLEAGLAVYEAGDDDGYVHFPTDSVACLVCATRDGRSSEIAIVGNEGVVGICLSMGGEITLGRALVQNAGNAYRLREGALKREFDRGGPLHYLLLQYVQTLMTQISQTAVCSSQHGFEQQLCRWLLLSLDRLHASELSMSMGAIADMLGVSTENVTDAARRLQAAGLIHCSGDRMSLLDRARLEARVCECYALVKRESDRLMRGTTAIAHQL